jgi:hypothetical protein
MAVGVLINYHLNLFTMAKNEKTSKRVASTAGKLLQNPKTPKRVKKVAASALTQSADKKRK